MTGAHIMPEIVCRQALERVLTYLGDDGVVLTTDNCRIALRLVEASMASGAGPDLLFRCIDSIPDYFEQHYESIPDANPPLKRGCIGYD